MSHLYLAIQRWPLQLLFLCSILAYSNITRSQTPVLSFNPVITSGLNAPVDIVSANDGTNRLFIVEQGGSIKLYSGGILSNTVFLDISGKISSGGERGLLSMAFHPGYQSNGYFFVYYTNLAGDITVERYHVDPATPNQAEPASGQVIIVVPHPGAGNHNGGKLNFGVDGYLYFATGDGGGGDDPKFNAQRGDVLLGKMLRIDVNNFSATYSIPADNPFVSDPAVADEIWAFGLRNPFRWSFDRLTHDMWIGDVGQSGREEIDFRSAGNTGGVNFGWRCYEGSVRYLDSGCLAASNYVMPVFEYGRNAQTGGQSVTGGYVYRGSAYPSLYGSYLCVDFYSRNGWLVKPNGSGGWTVNQQSGLPRGIAAFGENEAGELFAVSVLSDSVFQVQVASALPLKLQSFTAASNNGIHQISWTTDFEQQLRLFDIQYSMDGTAFKTIGTVPATNTGNTRLYRFNYSPATSEYHFYRLKIVNLNNSEEYSAIVKIGETNQSQVLITPTISKNERLTIRLNQAYLYLHVTDLNGRIVKTRNLSASTGTIYLDVSDLSKGMYIVTVYGLKTEVRKKILIQ